jgi:class 3 adenylate cyclase/pimeloyl-ACP methyl ester carboxylesterase
VSLGYNITGDGALDVAWMTGAGYLVEMVWAEPGFTQLMRRLRSFSRTIWFDGRGSATSGGNFQDIYKEGVVNADLTAVLDASGCEHVALIGCDYIGPNAIDYAARHPDRVKALVLVNTFAHYVREPDYAAGLPPEALERSDFTLRQGRGTGGSIDFLAPSKAGDPAFRERFAHYERLGATPDVAVEGFRRQCQLDVRELLPTITVPTLVLHRQGNPAIRVEAGRFLGMHIPRAKYVELPGEDTLFFVGDIDGLVDEIEEFLTGGHQPVEGDVVTATILFTDIVSSTEQAARMGHRRWTAVTAEHDAEVRRHLQRYGGREVKSIGDGFLATFDASTRAVRAAMEIVSSAGNMGLEVRAGVHAGEVEIRPDDVLGLPVSTAKRICDLASPGRVFVSENVKGLIEGSGIVVSDRGNHVLKGIAGARRLFAVEI